MAYNKKILGRAQSRLSAVRDANAEEHRRRVAEVYKSVPEIERVDALLRAQMIETVRISVSKKPDANEKIEKIRHENTNLQIERAEILVSHGYPVDYLDDIYSCSTCKDSGISNGSMCSCLKAIYNKELTAQLSTLLQHGDESFENFDLSLYPDRFSTYFSCIPREYMAKVYNYCRDYAQNFPNVTESLLLQGGTGLGKTYISACIARTVADKGLSVCYDTAVSAFSAFERQQFSRTPEESEICGEKVRHMLTCDLMILDDLGTELVTPAVLSALYTLINTRINNRLHTIINTNLQPDAISSRYSDAIASRIAGYFKTISFAGEDIRIIKKNR